MINVTFLMNDIEILREKLYFYLRYLEPTDSTVVDTSQELDKLLVLYEKSNLLLKRKM